MKIRLILSALAILIAGLLTTPAYAQDPCPDLSDIGPGVERIEGQGAYSFYGISIIIDQPMLALVDAAYVARGIEDEFAPIDGQVIGQLTSDFSTSPFSYTINLPINPAALLTDVDQDEVEETGVQIFSVALAQNILNTPFLEEFSQAGILSSYLTDSDTDEITEGTFLLYAPDDGQSFPCGVGEDGELFTADDPVVDLPAGYTVARIADGQITFDRSPVARIDVLEDPSTATPDFSDQGIAESYDTLIDFFKERYVFTKFSDIDWDALDQKHRPQVEQAEADGDLGLYYITLIALAQDLRDAHVYVQPGNVMDDPTASATVVERLAASFGDVGAKLVELDDGRVIVGSTTPGGPAEQAGITFGSEVAAINGVAIDDAIENATYYQVFPGTDETQRLAQLEAALQFPINEAVELTYRAPGESDESTVTITTTATVDPVVATNPMPLRYDIVDGFGYVTWPGFERTGISTHIYADFIKMMNEKQVPGIIIDLRGNGGGSAFMELAQLSYLYSDEEPLTFAGTQDLAYNEASGEFKLDDVSELLISAPQSAAPYTGEVVALVDENCASACEFMVDDLQRSGRATIIGQYATAGAGGNTNAVILPGQMQFNYTEGTTVFTDTQQPIFQGVGVHPDVRVEVTEETEQQKLEGGDPVLDAALKELKQAAIASIELQPEEFAEGAIKSVAPVGWAYDAATNEHINPEGTQILVVGPHKGDETDPDRIIETMSSQASKVGEYETEQSTWSIYSLPLGPMTAVVGISEIDGQLYLALIGASDPDTIAPLASAVLEPVMDAFEVVGK